MIRDKIFRLNRHRSSASCFDGSSHKFLFSFSNIQALQVPNGWDKLVLSMVSSESGKLVRKSGKVQVKNGTCQWSDSLSESIWISDTSVSKELDEYLIKFIISGASSKSSVLGETTLNLGTFTSSESPILVPLPLQKCSYGTVLQVEVTCLTPKTDLVRFVHNTRKEKNGDKPDHIENASEVDSYSSNFVETNISPSISCYSFDSADCSMGRQSSSPHQNGSNNANSIDGISYSSYSTVKSVRSIQGPFNQEKYQRPDDPTETRFWEQNEKKLLLDLETARKELSASHSDCQKLTQEVERLKSLLEESMPKRNTWRNYEIREMASNNIQKELEDDIRYQMVQNEDLSIQLRKTQESNIELIALLREMEETVEKQKCQIESFSANKLDLDEVSIIDRVAADELRTSQVKILFLETALEDKTIEAEIERDLRNHFLKSYLVEFSCRLDDKEQKIVNLEAALSQALSDRTLKESEQSAHVNVDELYKNNPNEEQTSDKPDFDPKLLEANTDCQETIERDFTISTFDCFSPSVSDAVPYSSSSISSHVSDNNNVKEILLLEAENINTQWVKCVSELEEENIYLTQRVYGLEAQLRYLTDAKESSCLELQHSGHQIMVLQDQVRRLEEEIESRKLVAKQKLQEVEQRWLEAREECENLGKLNVKLQMTTEAVVDECSLLQKLVGELKERTVKLEERCMFLEAETRNCQGICCMNDESKRELVDELESKLKDSEHRRLRLADENYMQRMQLQKVPELQNEVLGLRVLLKEMKSEARLLGASFESVSEDYEELKHERDSVVRKITNMSNAVLGGEDWRHQKNAVEEKVLRLEAELIVRDQLSVRDAEIRHELGRMKILNSELVAKVKHLQNKLQFYEDGRGRVEETNGRWTSESRTPDFVLENHRNSLTYPSQFNEETKAQDNCNQIQHKIQVFSEEDGHSTRLQVPEEYYETRVQLFGKEDIDAAKAKLRISQLEGELQEIRERYLQMSLRYAQVEVQREGLVMKLKAISS